MQFRSQKARCARFVAASLSVGLVLACGDDGDSSKESASTSDAGESSSNGGAAGGSSKSSAGKGGSTSTQSGGTAGKRGEAGAGGKSADTASDKDKDKDKNAGGKSAVTEPAKPGHDDTAKDDTAHEDAGVGDHPAEPKTLKVSVRFKAKVGKDDFACGHKYAGQGSASTTVSPRDLRLFVHELQLIKPDGTKVPVSLNPRAPWQSESVALLDFEDNTGRCTEGNAGLNAAITGTAPAGEYTGISFVSGLPDELNHKDPVMAGDPLKSAASLRLSELAGFRFAKIELVQLVAMGEPSGVGLLELGSTDCTGSAADSSLKCAKANRSAIELKSFDIEKNSVVIDVGAIFSQVDLTKAQECHSTEASCESMFQSFGLNAATGKPRDGQTVFKVE